MQDIFKLIKELLEQYVETFEQQVENIEDESVKEEAERDYIKEITDTIVYKRIFLEKQPTVNYYGFTLYYIDMKLYIIWKKYRIGVFYDIRKLAEGLKQAVDKTIRYVFLKSNPSTRIGTPILSKLKAFEMMGQLIDKYLQNNTKQEIFYIETAS